MSNKFGKTFRLTIQTNDNYNEAIVIEPPFSVEFDINRDFAAQANTGNFKIYNLHPKTRKRIFQDLFNLSVNRKVIFEAGYNGKLATLFFGTLKSAYSSRSGTEIITELSCWDEGFGSLTTAFISKTYSAGWTQRDIIKAQVQKLSNEQGVQAGEVGQFDTTQQPRGVALFGQSAIVLDKISGGFLGALSIGQPELIPAFTVAGTAAGAEAGTWLGGGGTAVGIAINQAQNDYAKEKQNQINNTNNSSNNSSMTQNNNITINSNAADGRDVAKSLQVPLNNATQAMVYKGEKH